MKDRPLLSIVIPVFNGEMFIRRTLESVMVDIPTDGLVEVLVVNDGSSDNTQNILNESKNKWRNLIVIQKENGGVSSARNVGFANAQGRYIYYLDADDEVLPNFYGVLIPCLKEYGNDLIVFGFNICKNSQKKYYQPKSIIYSLLDTYLRGMTRIGIWAIVAQRDLFLLYNISFDEHTSYGEDIEVLVKLLKNSKNTKIIKEALYNYYYDVPTSAMHHVFNEKRVSTLYARQRIIQYLTDNDCGKRLIKAAENALLVEYNLLLSRNKFSFLNTPECLSGFKYLGTKIPPFQISKYYPYNLYNWFKHTIEKIIR